MITSEQNSQVKGVVALQKKQKQRKKDQAYIVEGIKMVKEAPNSSVKHVYITEQLYSQQPDLIEGLPYDVVSDDVFKKMSDTITPQGILAVMTMPTYTYQEILNHPVVTLVLLEEIQDPGNLGTIIRTAEAIGATAVITTKGTVDIYNPKTLRSTMGAVYHLPIFNQVDKEAWIDRMKNADITLVAAHLRGEGYHYQWDIDDKVCYMIGNEGNGLTDGLTSHADRLIKIPMVGEAESLNASVATSILLYETYRQRNSK